MWKVRAVLAASDCGLKGRSPAYAGLFLDDGVNTNAVVFSLPDSGHALFVSDLQRFVRCFASVVAVGILRSNVRGIA